MARQARRIAFVKAVATHTEGERKKRRGSQRHHVPTRMNVERERRGKEKERWLESGGRREEEGGGWRKMEEGGGWKKTQ